MGHESKCAHLHGHNYVAFITAEAPLDEIGRVIDFGVLKAKVGGWIEKEWDHGFICHREDYDTLARLEQFEARPGVLQKLWRLHANPTAENMAEFLLIEVCPRVLADTGVTVTKVVLWETENCYATAYMNRSTEVVEIPDHPEVTA
jgi:6-pyruvoyltetrahydropterin/6-carboxytetrahydropterin synthase